MLTACQYGHLHIVKALCNNINLPSISNHEGCGLLHIGCKYGHQDIVQFCINNLNLDPYSSTESNFLTPLHFASMEGHLNILKLLLLEDAPSPTDHKGYTPLHYACQNGFLEIVHYIALTKRSELLKKSTDNKTALHIAICLDKVTIVKYFLEEIFMILI